MAGYYWSFLNLHRIQASLFFLFKRKFIPQHFQKFTLGEFNVFSNFFNDFFKFQSQNSYYYLLNSQTKNNFTALTHNSKSMKITQESHQFSTIETIELKPLMKVNRNAAWNSKIKEKKSKQWLINYFYYFFIIIFFSYFGLWTITVNFDVFKNFFCLLVFDSAPWPFCQFFSVDLIWECEISVNWRDTFVGSRNWISSCK